MSRRLGTPVGVLVSVQVGSVAALGPNGVPSGFVKQPVGGPTRVGALGLEGDEQADLTVHGGAEKAVYAYAGHHYVNWAMDFPEHRDRFTAGSLGENLTVEGVDETGLCVGDTHRIGGALLQVCQPRQPCFKLALRFGDNRLPKAMVRTERSGWYYRVLEPGEVRPRDTIILEDRPHPAFAFERLVRIVYHSQASEDELTAMAEMTGLASSLRSAAQRSLSAGKNRL